MSIASDLQNLKVSIAQTAKSTGRKPEEVRLVIVTKTISAEKILEAYHLGERDFGENRVQEWQDKKEVLPADIRWHLIGHLQTNKVKYVIGKVSLIHSLDRRELAEEIEKQARNKGIKEVPCLVQVNMSGEKSKFGLAPEEVENFIAETVTSPSIKLQGIMSIGPLTEAEAEIRRCFRRTRELLDVLKQKFPQHDLKILSMGMSADYKIAIEEGANLLRIGSLVFPRGIAK